MSHHNRNRHREDPLSSSNTNTHFGRGRNHVKHHGSNESRGGGGGARPPGLRGKEIGLFYRDRARARKEQEARPNHYQIDVDEATERSIMEMLDGVNRTPHLDKYKSTENVDVTDFQSKYTHIGESAFKQKFLEIISGSIENNLAKAMLVESKLQRNASKDKLYKEELENKSELKEYRELMEFRKKLPSYEAKDLILRMIEENQVILISGETGCGKTTQVAQFILDDQLKKGNGSVTKVMCTQPRRIAATSVAERVAAERAETLGRSVGFQIRLEKVPARESGSILYCTTGVALQLMRGDAALRDYSHIIIDEIHERSTDSDFILTLLKQVITKRRDLKVILMSATLNSELFSKYYDNCPNIHIPGFTYPVEEYFLEDVLSFTRFKFPEEPPLHKSFAKKYKQEKQKSQEYEGLIEPYIRHLRSMQKYPEYVLKELLNPQSEVLCLKLIEVLVRYICQTKGKGAILIFLPGFMDISNLNKLMVETGFYPPSRYQIYTLHSRLPTVEQRSIFKVPPEHVRKIIIATAIAETSITIEDVVYVIDSGKTKLSRFDVENNIETLNAEWISIANAKQRRGRAGRVQPGVCYHLYSKVRESTFDQYQLPEMLRTRLETVILQAKILQLGKVESFLSRTLDPPDPRAIKLSLELLTNLNALDSGEHLTPLGYHLAKLPVDPRTGKMLIWASLFSCIEPVFAIAASLSFKDAFYCPLGKESIANEKKLELSMNELSDHVALMEALKRFERTSNKRQFCHEYFLAYSTLKLLSEMKDQFVQHLHEMDFLPTANPRDPVSNKNSGKLDLIKAIVCAGLYPNVAVIKRVMKKHIMLATPEDGTVKIHPSSVNERATRFPYPYLIYYLKQKSTAIYLHDTTCVSPIALLFSSNLSTTEEVTEKGKHSVIVTLNKLLSFQCNPQTAHIIQKLRNLMDGILEFKITHPGTINWEGQEGKIMRAIIQLLSNENQERVPEIHRKKHESFKNHWEEYCTDSD